ncbi:hypothetical protein HRR83_005424 [Exophiala dermatitidis]|nr:hypothetical protein HRR74_005277 [Exophiala dermatitidis]KAJ4550126.1 hypothetical protein HRR77_003606 [Exophiala dermatitidis]KAJ4571623.1 hypothetical protein HRR81_005654 [Exophiala dermatitidis]KAJ4577715.1 hypothetical protein HRR79_001051 [Exophiala dermatitidis]KAJ4585823.1 hypothetical protein HRR82_002876 [Exophiala dermatitidis]
MALFVFAKGVSTGSYVYCLTVSVHKRPAKQDGPSCLVTHTLLSFCHAYHTTLYHGNETLLRADPPRADPLARHAKLRDQSTETPLRQECLFESVESMQSSPDPWPSHPDLLIFPNCHLEK